MPTYGDGNCWYRAVVDQMKRPEIRVALLTTDKFFSNHHKLRLAVVKFVRENQENVAYIRNFRNVYCQFLYLENNNRSWDDFLSHQEKNSVYATELFCQATTAFLAIDIFVNTENCNEEHPYNCISHDWEIGPLHVSSPNPMLIGSISQMQSSFV